MGRSKLTKEDKNCQFKTDNKMVMKQPEKITIDDVEYVRKDSVLDDADELEGMKYCIIRGDRSGVFAGYVQSRNQQEAIIRKARRLWYWSGASSLSQLAVDGTKKPTECKFPCEVETLEVTDVIEVIPATKKAQDSIKSVAVWEQ